MVHDPADQPDFPSAGFSDPGLDESELRARRSLGLGRAEAPKQRMWNGGDQQRRPGGTTHHKSRFVQDGEVPVVLVSNRTGRPDAGAQAQGADRARLADAESVARRERAGREQAEKDLAAAQTQLRDLQTRLAHAELARDEAQAAERAALERLEAALRAEPAAPAETQADADDILRPGPRPGPRPGRGRPRAAETADPAPTARRKIRQRAGAPAEPRVSAAPLPSDQPVKWWLSDGDEEDDEDARAEAEF